MKLFIFGRITAIAVSVFVLVWLIFRITNRRSRDSHFFFDPQDFHRANPSNPDLPKAAENTTFEPFLKHYISVTQLLVTVAAASIAFGSASGAQAHPPITNSKLLLAWSIFYGVSFCSILLWRYDEYTQNMRSYTLGWYSTIFALGLSSLLCFIGGYLLWGWELL